MEKGTYKKKAPQLVLGCWILAGVIYACGPEGNPPKDGEAIVGATWVRHIGNVVGDRSIHGVAELMDGDQSLGYAVAGTAGDGRSWVGLLDHDGGIGWSKAFGGRPVVPLRTQTAAVPTPQGGLLVAGEGADGRPHLVELDPTGAVIRTAPIGSDKHFIRGLAARPNSYLIAGGYYLNEAAISGWVTEVTLELKHVEWTAMIVPETTGALWYTAIATGKASATVDGPYGLGRGPADWVAVGQEGTVGHITSTIGAEDPAVDLKELSVLGTTQLTDVSVVGEQIVASGFGENGGWVARLNADLDTLPGWPQSIKTSRPPAMVTSYTRTDGVWLGVDNKLVVVSDNGTVKEVARSNTGTIYSVRGWPQHPQNPVVVTSHYFVDVFTDANSPPQTGVYGCGPSSLAVPTGVMSDGTVAPRLYTVGINWAEKPKATAVGSSCVYATDNDLAFEWGAPSLAPTQAAGGVLALPNGEFVASLSPVSGKVGLVRFTADGNVVWSRFFEGLELGEGVGWVPTNPDDSKSPGAIVMLARLANGQNPTLVLAQEDGVVLKARALSRNFSKVSGRVGGKGVVLTDRQQVVALWDNTNSTSLTVMEYEEFEYVADAVLSPDNHVIAVNQDGDITNILPDGTVFQHNAWDLGKYSPTRRVGALFSGQFVDVSMDLSGEYAFFGYSPPESCLNTSMCSSIAMNISTGYSTVFSTLAYDRPTGVIATQDGGILVFGTTRGYAYPREGAWLLKLNDQGSTGGACSAESPGSMGFYGGIASKKPIKSQSEPLQSINITEVPLQLSTLAVADTPEQGKSCSGYVTNEPVTLVVAPVGQGTIEVESDPPAESCGANCWRWPPTGAKVTLKATPAEGHWFQHWWDPMTHNADPSIMWSQKLITSKTLWAYMPPVQETWCNDMLDNDRDGIADCRDSDCVDHPVCNGCKPSCLGKECGDNGCGDSCGSCTDGAICELGQCVSCEPQCEGKQCGDNGCGGTCGSCTDGAICELGQCVSCEPQCEGKQCGDNGCGGTCGSCTDGATCELGQCVSCEPQCEGKQCGDNGCGGTCGSCTDGSLCELGQCVPCEPQCEGKLCGDDGCGGTCGSCTDGTTCVFGQCIDEQSCADAPIAAISVSPGTNVVPETKLWLSGLGSFSPTGNVAAYAWTVSQPEGSVSVLAPSTTAPEVTFTANVAGNYVFQLHVWDNNGVQSCVPATVMVEVVPTAAIHVVLVWDTPGDLDQTDEGPEAGADMDLHVAHPLAKSDDIDKDGQPDPWFNIPFDCYWFNSNPNWGNLGSAGDPELDRDDTDGAGPELVSIPAPESGITYRVGVHYWNDFKFGPSWATLRVYIDGVLMFERTGVEMNNLDMWEAVTIAWPSGAITPITGPGGGDKITPNYKAPLF